jgi:hypothetical protein
LNFDLRNQELIFQYVVLIGIENSFIRTKFKDIAHIVHLENVQLTTGCVDKSIVFDHTYNPLRVLGFSQFTQRSLNELSNLRDIFFEQVSRQVKT